jgi:hypothetical protein
LQLQELKVNKDLKSDSLNLSKQLSSDYLYRNLSYALLVLFIVAAFFISLASAQFDFAKILQAQFWIDFSITFGGGMILKWAFGKYGNYEGHKNKEVIKEIRNIESANTVIKERNLIRLLSDYVKFNNDLRKLKAIKNKVFTKINGANFKKDKWLSEKESVLIAEKWIMAGEGTEDKEKYEKELTERNFDLDSYKIKYPYINESTLKTGFAGREDEDEKMSFNEYYELFGKNSLVTSLSIVISVLLAISTVIMDEITLRTFFVFFTRIAMYGVNSYVGFAIGKSAVETVKLNILTTINRFLNTFLEENEETNLNTLVLAKEQNGGEQEWR